MATDAFLVEVLEAENKKLKAKNRRLKEQLEDALCRNIYYESSRSGGNPVPWAKLKKKLKVGIKGKGE